MFLMKKINMIIMAIYMYWAFNILPVQLLCWTGSMLNAQYHISASYHNSVNCILGIKGKLLTQCYSNTIRHIMPFNSKDIMYIYIMFVHILRQFHINFHVSGICAITH